MHARGRERRVERIDPRNVLLKRSARRRH
jgi:hypothetical protein